MKKLCFLLCFLIFGVCLQIVKADLTGVKGLTITGDYAIYSAYYWRGFELDSDPVIQAGLSVCYDVVTLSIWNSQDIAYDDGVNSAEVDFTVDISKTFGDVSVSIGNTKYTFPAVSAESSEAYLSLVYDTLLSPGLSIYYDYGDEADGGGDGTYTSLSIAHSIEAFKDGSLLELSASLGFNQDLFISGNGGDIGLGASLSMDLGNGMSLTPSLNYVIPFGDMSDDAVGAQESSFYGGFSIGYSM